MVKEIEADLDKEWLDQWDSGYRQALKDVLGLIDKMKQEFSDIKINPHKAYAKPHQIYDLCIKKLEELKARITR